MALCYLQYGYDTLPVTNGGAPLKVIVEDIKCTSESNSIRPEDLGEIIVRCNSRIYFAEYDGDIHHENESCAFFIRRIKILLILAVMQNVVVNIS